MDVLIIDYSMGNLRSVENAFRALDADVVVSAEPAELRNAARVVLPGVGAFGDGIRNLRNGGWIEPLADEVRKERKPFLGLCLGMQLLATRSHEHGVHDGLGWIEGVVDRLPQTEVRVPHVGWNEVEIRPQADLYEGLSPVTTFYFVHSYVFRPADETVVTGVSVHGTRFAASIEEGNLHATQFHPEKSQAAGLAVLHNFLRRC